MRQRTDLYIELALINWLNWGVDQGNASIIADAQELLNEQLERLDGDSSLTGRPLYAEQDEIISEDTAELNQIATEHTAQEESDAQVSSPSSDEAS